MKKTLTAIAMLLSASVAQAEDTITIEFAYPYSHLFDVTYEKILPKFKEQHRAEFAVYEAACAYFKANGLRTLPDLKKLDAEYQTLSSEKNGFYTRYKKAQIELRELRTAQQNVEAFFRKEERSHAVPQQEVK